MITQGRLKDYLSYNPETGLFKRLTSKHSVAVITHAKGYLYIKIGSKSYFQHRLAFLYMTGLMPSQVDHINHNRSDNRWENLRSADQLVNMKNKSKYKNNSSGFTGVRWNEDRCKWQAAIARDGKNKHLGLFENLSDAVLARVTKEEEYGFHCNHGGG